MLILWKEGTWQKCPKWVWRKEYPPYGMTCNHCIMNIGTKATKPGGGNEHVNAIFDTLREITTHDPGSSHLQSIIKQMGQEIIKITTIQFGLDFPTPPKDAFVSVMAETLAAKAAWWTQNNKEARIVQQR